MVLISTYFYFIISYFIIYAVDIYIYIPFLYKNMELCIPLPTLNKLKKKRKKDGSETSEEDEKDSSRLEIIHKICLQTNISTSCN